MTSPDFPTPGPIWRCLSDYSPLPPPRHVCAVPSFGNRASSDPLVAEASEQLLGMRLTGRSRGALFLRELEAARPQGVEPQGSIVVEGMAGIGASYPLPCLPAKVS
jgi:hypothetical protein